jgi:hypothetical protein
MEKETLESLLEDLEKKIKEYNIATSELETDGNERNISLMKIVTDFNTTYERQLTPELIKEITMYFMVLNDQIENKMRDNSQNNSKIINYQSDVMRSLIKIIIHSHKPNEDENLILEKGSDKSNDMNVNQKKGFFEKIHSLDIKSMVFFNITIIVFVIVIFSFLKPETGKMIFEGLGNLINS